MGYLTTQFPETDLGDACADAYREAYQATKNWPPFNSAHERFAVLNEEFHERAFRGMAGDENMKAAIDAHREGLLALGLIA